MRISKSNRQVALTRHPSLSSEPAVDQSRHQSAILVTANAPCTGGAAIGLRMSGGSRAVFFQHIANSFDPATGIDRAVEPNAKSRARGAYSEAAQPELQARRRSQPPPLRM
jgi:hypothetical protein